MRFASALILTTTVIALTGCGMTSNGKSSGAVSSSPVTAAKAGVNGTVFGGQQPIYQAAIQLYEAGAIGYGTGAKALLTQTVLTDINGNFSITGLYTCDSGSMVYIVATGGQPTTGVTNTSAALIAGLGLCSNLNASTFISLNEITTVGTVWALAPFMNGVNIGAPASNTVGLVNAFADINTLVSTAVGVPQPSQSLVTLPVAEINTLANIIGTCINSAGASVPACSTLFSNTPNADGSTPTDTITAAINMARNPASNVTAIVNNISTMPPFAPALASLPDFTLAVTYLNGGISAPSGLAVDAAGNVWIANSTAGKVTKLSHTGTYLSGTTGYAVGASPSAIAIDQTGNAWVTNSGSSTLTELSSSGATLGTYASTTLSALATLSSPSSIAFDPSGNLWVANAGNNTFSEFTTGGSLVLVSPGSFNGTSYLSAPVGVAIVSTQ